MDMDTVHRRTLRSLRHVFSGKKTLVRMGNRPHPLNSVVHLLHHLQKTRLHRHVTHVVDHVPHQPHEMAARKAGKSRLI